MRHVGVLRGKRHPELNARLSVRRKFCLRKDSKGGSNPESLSPAGMSCVRTEDNDVFVAADRAFQKLVGKRS